jgi:adenine-specific DNA-methyltransferase
MTTGVSQAKWKGEVTTHEADTDYSDVDLDVCLSYEGKLPERDILSTPPGDTVELWRGEAASRNRLFFGDNLPILAGLLQDSSVCGKVRLVYIDPPFATKRVYKSRKQKDAYSDVLVGAHYVEYLRKRLILLRELLAEDGSICVHLDQNMAFHIKLIMDEVFGPANFRNWITRKKCNPKNYTRKTYGNISDYILFYTKSEEYVWNRAYEPWTEERAREYRYVEKGTGRRFMKVPVHAPGVRNGETGKPWRGMNPPPGKHWQFPPSTLDEMDARGEIYWSPTGNPRRKRYLDESPGVPVQDIWMDFKDAHNQMIKITGYPTEKNPQLLARIIEASSNEGDLVLDCFCGSGTTLGVASQLGRNWIGIDNSSEAIVAVLQRFTVGLERMGDFVSQRKQSNNREGSRESTLPLFDFAGLSESERVEQKRGQTDLLSTFSFHTVASHSDQMKNILEQWIRSRAE